MSNLTGNFIVALIDWSNVLLVAGVVFSIVVFALARVFARGVLVGPIRLLPNESPRVMLLPLAVGFLAGFIGARGYYSAVAMSQNLPVGQTPQLNDAQTVLLNVAFEGAALIGMIATILVTRRKPLSLIGLSPGRAPAGIVIGVIAILAVFPWIVLCEIATQYVLVWLKLKVPIAHDLLLIMARADRQWLRTAVILSAGVLAPISEEMFFRVHVQTFFRYTFNRPWLAVVLSSLLFMMVHDKWAWPAIFVLALSLGYVYERTGNLWACLTMHALFNVAEMAIFWSVSRTGG